MDFISLASGILCAAIGGELFVRGIVGIATWARISSGIIAVTFAAFATSSPELSVSITSALAGTPQIALGDALGSNVTNIGLILGIALLIAPLHASTDSVKRVFPVALAVPILLAMLARDGQLSKMDGLILLTLFSAWMIAVTLEARKQRSMTEEISEDTAPRSVLETLTGLALLVASGKLIVSGAAGLAAHYGVEPFLIGATLVALGTSAPEFATVVIARLRGHDEIGLGTVLGSNIFNGLFIIGVASVINPIPIHWPEISLSLLLGLITCICILPCKCGEIGRQRGALLICLYAVYIVWLAWGM